jgi:hypothetical protein
MFSPHTLPDEIDDLISSPLDEVVGPDPRPSRIKH